MYVLRSGLGDDAKGPGFALQMSHGQVIIEAVHAEAAAKPRGVQVPNRDPHSIVWYSMGSCYIVWYSIH